MAMDSTVRILSTEAFKLKRFVKILRFKKFAIEAVLILVMLGVTFTAVNRLLLPKYYYNGDWPATSTFLDFYNMDKDSVDVLFLGSSHCTAAFSPVELYEKYHIKSYNLGSEQQNLLISYYWLQEALRYQKPAYVFLDTYFLYPYSNETSPLNSSEATVRKAIDFMKWSPVKFEAIRAICEEDESQNIYSYIFPNHRFHSRWRELTENDFILGQVKKHETLMGFSPLNFTYADENYQPFTEPEEPDFEEMVPVMEEYLIKIVELCKQENIELVLVKTPTEYYSMESWLATRRFAKRFDINYIDFNEASVFRAAGLDFTKDTCDTDHVNLSGASKVTDYIGEWLDGKVTKSEGHPKWDERVKYYQHYLHDQHLKAITDPATYINYIREPEYAVFLAAKGDASNVLTEGEARELGFCGLSVEYLQSGGSYAAVLEGGQAKAEESVFAPVKLEGTVRNGLSDYSIESFGGGIGGHSRITLFGNEFSVEQEGLTFIVFCEDKKDVIDKVTFTYTEDGVICTR